MILDLNLGNYTDPVRNVTLLVGSGLQVIVASVIPDRAYRRGRRWALGLVPGSVQFFKGLRADSTNAYWSAHKAFYETSLREPMAALPGEPGGNPARDGSARRPGRAVRGREVAVQDRRVPHVMRAGR